MLRGVQPSAAIRVIVAQFRHAEFAAGAVKLALTALVTFRTFEIGQDRTVIPSGRSLLRPVVIVLALSANVQQSVDRTGAADDPPARPGDGTPSGAFSRLGRKEPGEALVVNGLEVADGQAQPKIAIPSAGFQHCDPHAGIRRQPIGEHAAGGAGSHDDVIEFHASREFRHHALTAAR